MRLINYIKYFLLTPFLLSSKVMAGGYYYPVPANPQPLQYFLPPAYYPSSQIIYIAPPPIIRGVPPTFVPFDTGRAVPLPPKVDLYPQK